MTPATSVTQARSTTARIPAGSRAPAVKAGLGDDVNGNALVDLAATFAKEPARFRQFVDAVFAMIPAQDDEASDIAEDREAWSDLVRSIGKTIGRNAPLEQFLQELAIRSKEAPVGNNTMTLKTIHGARGKNSIMSTWSGWRRTSYRAFKA